MALVHLLYMDGAVATVSSLRVLVLEGDPHVRELYRALLTGHDVVEAETLARARAALAGRGFDLVITDWHLPDGFASGLLEELRARGDGGRRLLHAALEPEQLGTAESSGLIHWFLPRPSWFQLSRVVSRLAMQRTPPTGTALKSTTRPPRVTIALTAFVRCDAWTAVRRLATENVSEQGLALRSPEPAPVGADVSIALVLPDGARRRLRGVVCYAMPAARGDGSADWRVGVRLDDLLPSATLEPRE